MAPQRIQRLNSLLREVLSDTIRREVKDPRIPELITVTRVEITNDLHYAKVYISVIDPKSDPNAVIKQLQKASGFIGMSASKQVVMRYFPHLTFVLDESAATHMRIDQLLSEIHQEEDEKESRPDEL